MIPGLWHFGSVVTWHSAEECVTVRGVTGRIRDLYSLLGADRLASLGYLVEVLPEDFSPGEPLAPLPFVDIEDGGRPVARRMTLDQFKKEEIK